MFEGQGRKLLPFFLTSTTHPVPVIPMCSRLVRRLLLLALAVVLACADEGSAEVSTTQPGALLVFPKVVSDQNQDTLIQISNATGSRITVRCFYVNGATDVSTGQPSWLITDFKIVLTRGQPTVWVAGTGLPAAPPPNRPPDSYPGAVPPVSVGFLGELRCTVVNDSESPISRNALTGEATIIDRTTHMARKYQAISLQGLPANNGDNTLLLDDVEYDTCPRVLLLKI